MYSETQKKTVQALVSAIVDTIIEAGSFGAPASALYLALQSKGMTLASFQNVMATLVRAGLCRLENDAYFPGARK